jgi:hypothetical protein
MNANEALEARWVMSDILRLSAEDMRFLANLAEAVVIACIPYSQEDTMARYQQAGGFLRECRDMIEQRTQGSKVGELRYIYATGLVNGERVEFKQYVENDDNPPLDAEDE